MSETFQPFTYLECANPFENSAFDKKITSERRGLAWRTDVRRKVYIKNTKVCAENTLWYNIKIRRTRDVRSKQYSHFLFKKV